MLPPPPPSAADHHPILPDADDHLDHDEDDDLEDDDVDMQLDDDEDLALSSSSFSSSSSSDDEGSRNSIPNPNPNPTENAAAITLALQPVPLSTLLPGDSEPKRPRGAGEDSRRLFQRLWTDEDEIVILRGFRDFTLRRGTAHHAHQHDTGPFYDQIRARLRVDFTKSQLVEKVRRLKKKYRNTLARMGSSRPDLAFKSPHDRETFELSQVIWGGEPASQPYPDADYDGNGIGIEQEVARERRQRRKRRSISVNSAVAEGPGIVPVEVKSVPTLATAMLDYNSGNSASAPLPVEVKFVPEITATVPVDVKPVPILGSIPRSSVNQAEALPTGNPNAAEEALRNCLSPLFKDLLSYAMGGSVNVGATGGIGSMPVGFLGDLPKIITGDAVSEGKWRKQQISELEVYSKRLELVQEQIKVTLEELRSSEGS